MEKYNESRKWKKMTYSTPNINDWYCLECRSLQLRMVYEEKRIKTLTKKELAAEAKKLRAKCEKIFEEEETYERDLNDGISSEDDKEEDYLPPIPKQRKLVKRKKNPHLDKVAVARKSKKNLAAVRNKKILTSPKHHKQSQTTPKPTKSQTPIKEKEKEIQLKRVNFQKVYKGPKRYYPGTEFSYKFEHIKNEEEREYLLTRLE